MRQILYGQAITEALREEMRRDENVFIIGEDMGVMGSVFGLTKGFIEEFGEVNCDFYTNENQTPCMTSEQLGSALGYSDPQKAISNLVNRNEYLEGQEFSSLLKLRDQVQARETRVFTEDGIYEVTMLAKTEKAKSFRSWVRKILKGMRTGELKLTQPSNSKTLELEIKNKNAEARLKNAQTRQANFLLEQVEKRKHSLSAESVELLTTNAFEMIAGKNALPRPKVEPKYYTATEIGEMVNKSSSAVGKLANANNLKTAEYGHMVLDKSPHSVKQVETFRYNEAGKEKLLELLGKSEAV